MGNGVRSRVAVLLRGWGVRRPVGEQFQLRAMLIVHGFGFVVLMLLTRPGVTVTDTKHDLTAAPGKFLRGAWQFDSPLFPLGQIQNQVYGYLFPQGAWFWFADPLPDWIAQRLWWALVLWVAFAGMVLLCRRVTGCPVWGCWAAGLAYATAPRMVATVGSISSEAWPVAVAPWIVLPLANRRLGRYEIAQSLVAVAMVGAVNATATLWAYVPAGVLLLMRMFGGNQAGMSRRRMLRLACWWLAGVLLVSVWWLVPLFILGRYSPPFTEFIESAAVTTRWFNPVEVLRGTTHWVPFVDFSRPAAARQRLLPAAIVATSVCWTIGLAGLIAAKRLPISGRVAALPRPLRQQTMQHMALLRSWAVLLASCGVVLLLAAHGPAGPQWQSLLDGAGAPLRNLHKADVLIRVPLSLGIGYAALIVQQTGNFRLRRRQRQQSAAALLVLVVACAGAPILTGQSGASGGWRTIPAAVGRTAELLNTAPSAATSATLLYPATPFARFQWGNPNDEPLQALLAVPWVVRDAIPLVNPEAIRMLDGLYAILATPAQTIAPQRKQAMLQALGYSHVVIRQDLADPAQARAARALSAQLHSANIPVHTFDAWEVFDLHATPVAHLAAYDAAAVVPLVGAGEALALVTALLGESSYVPSTATAHLPADSLPLAANPRTVVTDTPIPAAHNYARVVDHTGEIAADPALSQVNNQIDDYPSAADPAQVVREGFRITPSSSAGSATAVGGARPGSGIVALTDGDPTTVYRPAPGTPQAATIYIAADNQQLPRNTTAMVPVTITTAGSAVTIVRDHAPDPWQLFPNTIPANLWDQQSVNTIAPFSTATLLLPADDPQHTHVTVVAEQGQLALADLVVGDHPVTYAVSIPGSYQPLAWVFQTVNNRSLIRTRQFVQAATREYVPDSDRCTGMLIDGAPLDCGEPLQLSPGPHTVTFTGSWVTLTATDLPLPQLTPVSGSSRESLLVPAASQARILFTQRGYLRGLQATAGETLVDTFPGAGGLAAALLPAATAGAVDLHHEANRLYQLALAIGLMLWLIVLGGCGIIIWRHRRTRPPATAHPTPPPTATTSPVQALQRDVADYLAAPVKDCSPSVESRIVYYHGTQRSNALADMLRGSWWALLLWLCGGLLGLLIGVAVYLVTSFRIINRALLATLAMLVCGLWLAHGPWTSPVYAGDAPFVTAVGLIACACLLVDTVPLSRRRGSSTHS
ncbi:alpha-(1-_3)-arabinofuranosyltransferase family protein [Corynebacterium choanae]|uniref:Alpha-(1->3)-arabinofuranosyltransferase n=1 Tax=Corynebacterium choanae TaxID=1862358 RepID=A0A3G6J3U5_9CORY|nr:alpha-(1->3)-arabinofuranosyltransferase family protein [Corynebacterium choanae]AZA12606.1 Alpha-(1->3)-arabinofuranosyltransferase [Corynebacterium choanae]